VFGFPTPIRKNANMKRSVGPRRRRRKSRPWGGTRITKIKCLLIGDRNVIEALPADHPRRRVSLPLLRCLEPEEAQS